MLTSRRNRSRRPATALAAVALTLAGAACGGDDDASEPSITPVASVAPTPAPTASSTPTVASGPGSSTAETATADPSPLVTSGTVPPPSGAISVPDVPHEAATEFTQGDAESAFAVDVGGTYETTLSPGGSATAVFALGTQSELQAYPDNVSCEGPPPAGDAYYQLFDVNAQPVSDAVAVCSALIGDIVPIGTYYAKFVGPVDGEPVDILITLTAAPV